MLIYAFSQLSPPKRFTPTHTPTPRSIVESLKIAFIDNVKTGVYFNSDAFDDPEDLVIEDFKAFCASNRRLTAQS
jgi:hypothetical protein